MLNTRLRSLSRSVVVLFSLASVPRIASADVDSSGAFLTSVPLKAPAYHGLEPQLQLSYHSGRGNGWLGVGWTLSGASAITRASAGKGAPSYDNTDKYFLDGQELIPCTPGMQSPSCKYPASPTHKAYTTKIESFLRIAADGSLAGGPASWYVWNKSGTKLTYEPRIVNAAKGTFAWSLASVEDTLGNKVLYQYWKDASAATMGEAFLDSVSYNGVLIKFYSELRTDVVTYATGADLVTMRYRLKSIDITVGNARARAYRLTYKPGPSTRSLLSEVQEVGSDAAVDALTGEITGGTALPPTKFLAPSLTANSTGRWSSGISASIPWGPPWPTNGGVAGSANFNDQSNLDWNLQWGTQRWFPGDINGDGRQDLMNVFLEDPLATSPPFYTLRAARSNADGTYTYFTKQIPSWNWSHSLQADFFRALSSDINGDGRSDFIIIAPNSNDVQELWVRPAISNGDGTFDIRTASVLPVSSWSPWRRWFSGDVNGDGKDDLMFVDWRSDCDAMAAAQCGCGAGATFDHSHLHAGISRGDGSYDFKPAQETCWSFRSNDAPNWFVGDADGDGKSDFMRILNHLPDQAQPRYAHAAVQTAVARGDGTFALNSYDTLRYWLTAPPPDFYLGMGKGSDLAQVGDFNGDGKSDFLFINYQTPLKPKPHRLVFSIATVNVAGTYEIAEHDTVDWNPRLLNFYWEQQIGQKLYPNRWLAGDFDGDGATDLAIVSPSDVSAPTWPTTVNILKLLSDRKGGFVKLPVSQTSWFNDCYSNPDRNVGTPTTGGTTQNCDNDLMFTVFAGDANGDGTADIMYAGHRAAGSAVRTTLHVDVSPGTGLDTFRWMTTDVNGDQYEDRTYVYSMNPGVRVYTLLAVEGKAQGAPVPEDHFTGLQNPVMRNWRTVDVGGGPGGAPDGKADLVYVSTLNTATGTGTKVYTLFSKGNGTWEEKPPFDLPNVNAQDSLHWVAGDVNGDGRGDLVHVACEQSQISVTTLLSNGDGTWIAPPGGLIPPPSVSTFATPDTLSWVPTDVNGDGRTDLVHVDHLPAGLRVHSLLSRGDGTWDPRWDDPWPGFSATNQKGWMPIDVNADGKRDLLQLVPAGTGLQIHTLIAKGDGTWVRQPEQDVWQGPYPTTGDTNNWRAADINGDGNADLVHLRDWGSKVLIESLLSKGDGTWAERGPDFRAWPGSVRRDTVLWKPGDADGDTRAELSRLDYESSALRISLIASDAWLDLLGQAQGGLGSDVAISYRAAHAGPSPNPAAAPNLPVGMHFMVVAGITMRDGRQGDLGRETYAYGKPRWSYQERTLVGWREVAVQHGQTSGRPPLVISTQYQAFDQGIIRPFRIERKEQPQGGGFTSPWSYEELVYQPIGNSPPYGSEIAARFEYHCSMGPTASTTCTPSHSDLTFDEFGNLVQVMDYGSGKQGQLRTLQSAYFPATGPYIVGLPASETIYAGDTTGTRMRATAYTYDANASWASPPTKGLLASTDAVNEQTGDFSTTAFEYDAYGNRTKVTDPNLHATTTSYDPLYHLFPQSICNALNQCSSMEWDAVLGMMKKVTDANGKSTVLTYDPLGRLKSTVFPDQGTTTFEYVDFGDPGRQHVHETSSDGSTDGLWMDTYLDGLGRSYRVVKKGDRRGATFVRDTRFDGVSAQIRKESHWYRTIRGTTPPVYETFSYDSAGRVVRQAHPDGSFLSWEYANDAHHNLVIATDEAGHRTEAYVDAQGRVAQVRERDGTAFYATGYEYDVVDNLTTITDHAGNVTTFTWDSLGRKVEEKAPDRGSWTYQYDNAGNLTGMTDARGLKTAFTYDALNRLKTKQWGPPGGEQAAWSYDEPGHGAGIGRLTSVADPTGKLCGPSSLTEQLSYDSMGRVTSRTKCILGKSYGIGFGYDSLGRLQTLTYPDQEVVTYRYNPAGRLHSIPGYVNVMFYDATGALTSVHLANGTRERYQYNSKRHWLASASVIKGGQTLYQAGYEHLADGLISRTDSTTNKMNLRFSYDDLHRLTWVEDDYTQHLEYDAIGNITYNTRAGGSYIYPPSGPNGCGPGLPCAGPHALKGINHASGYGHDANGNMALRDGRQIWWDVENRPEAVKTPQGGIVYFAYDASGQRVYKDGPLDDIYYFGPQFELSDSNGLTKLYYAGSRLVARKDSSGTFWYHGDHLGSTRIITNQAGSVVQRYDYRPFGEKEKSSATFANSIDYAGARTDDEIGLVYMNGRYYDPWLAKFISADPVIPDAANPQAGNRYAYAYNNPLSFTDPTGHQPEPEGPVSDPSEWNRWLPGVVQMPEDPVVGCVYSDPPLVAAEGEERRLYELENASSNLVTAVEWLALNYPQLFPSSESVLITENDPGESRHGLTGTVSGNITLTPGQSVEELVGTVAHELMHSRLTHWGRFKQAGRFIAQTYGLMKQSGEHLFVGEIGKAIQGHYAWSQTHPDWSSALAPGFDPRDLRSQTPYGQAMIHGTTATLVYDGLPSGYKFGAMGGGRVERNMWWDAVR
jgi:RHS repeat-associated protein